MTLAVGACGSDDDDPAATPTSAGPAATASSAASSAPGTEAASSPAAASSDAAVAPGEVDYNKLSVAELYEGAKKEGEFLLNSGASEKDLKVISDTFTKLYPGIKMQHVEQQGEDSAAKFAEEAKAGVHKLDVLDIDQLTMFQVAKLGLLAKYSPPEAANFDPRLAKPEYTGYRIQIKPIGYNTEKVKPEDVPKTYADLLDPKYKNKVCAESNEISVFGNMIEDMGEAEAVEYWKALQKNGLRLISGQSNLIEALKTGDCPIAQSANVHSISKDQESGAPIDWVRADPLPGIAGAIAVAAKAPHPYAARLWVNYMLSKDGQESLVKNYRIPANPAVPPQQPELQPGKFTMTLPTDKQLEEFPRLTRLFYEATGRPVIGQ